MSLGESGAIHLSWAGIQAMGGRDDSLSFLHGKNGQKQKMKEGEREQLFILQLTDDQGDIGINIKYRDLFKVS